MPRQVLIPLAGVVDLEAQRIKIERDLKRVEAEIQALSGRLGNPGFVNKAPADVVERGRVGEVEQLADVLAAHQVVHSDPSLHGRKPTDCILTLAGVIWQGTQRALKLVSVS